MIQKYSFSLFILLLSTCLNGWGFNVDTLFICKNTRIGYTSVTTQGNPIAWEWTFEGATPGSSTMQNPSGILYPTAGVFLTTIKTTFDNNTDTTDSVYVVVYDDPMPAFSFPKDTGYCIGANFSLDLNTLVYPRANYEWSTGAKTPNITINTKGTYWVRLVLRAGSMTCDSVYKELTVAEYPAPKVNLGPDRLMCQNQVIPIDAGAGVSYTYNWLPNGETTRVLNVTLPGVYSVTVSNAFKCVATDQIEFKDSCPHYIFVPNAVSPNEDRLNDLFTKVWNFTPKDYTFTIYNRWGELLFETQDPTKGWDCKVNGSLVSQDIYVYKITYFDTDKKWYELRGTFYVVR